MTTTPSLPGSSESPRPPRDRYSGTLGAEFYILTKSEVRFAERMHRSERVVTADGPVNALPGHFVVSMHSGERYPIKPEVFFGTYEILSRVGSWFVGQRLLHPRRAWEVLSPSAEFDYAPGRGRVSATKGAWIYQSDETDYGLINASVNARSHDRVGPVAEVDGINWTGRYEASTVALAFVPVLLTAMALCSIAFHSAAEALLGAEAALLLGALFFATWIRHRHWSLRSALSSGSGLMRDFQVAVELLGEAPSANFPAMSLWRAAQDDKSRQPLDQPDLIRRTKDLIGEWFDKVQHRLARNEAIERLLHGGTWAAAVLVLGCLVALALTHDYTFKYFAVWLPSAIGAAHAWSWGQQSLVRVSADRNLLIELNFARQRLVSLTPDDHVDASSRTHQDEVEATLRMLCRCVARYAQIDLRAAAAHEPAVPI